MQAINFRQPAYKSTSDRISTNQKLMNIRQSQIDELLKEIRDGKAMPGFSEENGDLMYTDAVGTRQVVALEERDRVMDDLWTSMGDIGLNLKTVPLRARTQMGKYQFEQGALLV